MASGVTIIVNLTVYVCAGYLPVYEVVLSTTGIAPSTMSIRTPSFMASTILPISNQRPSSVYNVSLELVDPCQSSTVATRHVVTDMAPTGKYCRVLENMFVYFISLLAVACLLYIAFMSY